MQTSKLPVTLVLIAFAGHCMSAKVPQNAEKDLKPSPLKQNKITDNLKQSSELLTKQKKTKDSSHLKSKEAWSAKSVIVRPSQRNAVVRTQVSTNPLLNQLYEQRYRALEEVDKITNKINSIIQRNAQRKSYASAVSSFMNPALYSSGSYGVQGGSVVLGPANAGSVAGVENAQIRQLAVKIAKHHHVNTENNAPVDMPQPMDDSENTAQKPTTNAVKANDEEGTFEHFVFISILLHQSLSNSRICF